MRPRRWDLSSNLIQGTTRPRTNHKCVRCRFDRRRDVVIKTQNTENGFATEAGRKAKQQTGASAPQHRKETMKINITDRIQWFHTCAWLPTLILAATSALANDNRAPEGPAEIAVAA